MIVGNGMNKQVVNNKNLFFSIIIPLYNKEMYVAECLESILKQTYCNWEAIIVDDGSTDGSVDVVKRFLDLDNRIICIRQDNKGPGLARNEGIKRAKGDYLLFLDADDFWNNDEILAIVNDKIKRMGGTLPNVIGTNICKFRDGKVENSYSITKLVASDRWIEFETIGDSFYYFSAYIYDVNFLRTNNVLFPKGTLFEDPCFLAKVIVVAEKFYFITDSFYVYRMTDGFARETLFKNYSENQMTDYLNCLFEVSKMAKECNRQAMLSMVADSIIEREGMGLLKQFIRGNYYPLARVISGDNELGIELDSCGQIAYIKKAVRKKALDDIENFMKKVEENDYIYIYGAGLFGHIIASILLESGINKEKICFCTSESLNNESIMGIECRNIWSLELLDSKTLMIVAANSRNQVVMKENIKRIKFENVIYLSDELLYSITLF